MKPSERRLRGGIRLSPLFTTVLSVGCILTRFMNLGVIQIRTDDQLQIVGAAYVYLSALEGPIYKTARPRPFRDVGAYPKQMEEMKKLIPP